MPIFLTDELLAETRDPNEELPIGDKHLPEPEEIEEDDELKDDPEDKEEPNN